MYSTFLKSALILRMDFEMVNIFVIAGGTLAIPILAFIASFYLWPAALIKVYYCDEGRYGSFFPHVKGNWVKGDSTQGASQYKFTASVKYVIFAWYWRRRLRMQVDYAEYEGYRFCYSHRGSPGARPSVLMLHGFSAHKDMWLAVVKFMPKNVHLVCVDMPGHEGTSRTSAVDYSIEGQVRRINQFVKRIRLNRKPFHLIGTSMGGNVAGVYAARHPSDLCGVTLICPAGLQYPTESTFVQRLRELEKTQDADGIPLIPSTPDEMEQMLKLCSHVRFKIPRQILQGLVEVRIPNNDFYRECFMELVGEKSRHSLHENMHLITVPLQVIWGENDQVLDVSGASVLAEAVPGCQVHLLDNCGHTVVMERPRKSAQLIMDFIVAQQNASNSTKKLS